MKTTIAPIVSALALALGMASSAHATADDTWVSRNGSDANTNCPVSAPCRTFQVAHNQTNPGGTINVLDDGDYSTVIITKSITIMAVGKIAKIRSSITNTIEINAADTDKVVLQGLTLDSVNLTFRGVYVFRAGSVYVIDSTIKNGFVGISNNSATAGARVFVQRCNLLGNAYGAFVLDPGKVVSVLDSLVDGSTSAGLASFGGIIGVARTVINAGPTAILTQSGGQVISIGPSNIVSGAGAFSATVPFN